MGKSADARNAAAAVQKNYYASLKEIKDIDGVKRASTSNKRSIEDSYGDGLSYSSKRLAMKADKLGQNINTDDKYKTAVNNYKLRYEQMQRQLNGENVARYSVNDGKDFTPSPPVERSKNNATWFGGIGNDAQNIDGSAKASGNGLSDYANAMHTRDPRDINPKDIDWMAAGDMQGRVRAQSERNASRTYYNTQEEAVAASKDKLTAYNANLDSLLNTTKPRSSLVAAGNYTQTDIDKMRITDPAAFVKKQELGGIANGWQDALGVSLGAGEDMQAAANLIKAAPANQYIQQYSDIALKLRAKLGREQNLNQKPGGLLSAELAGSNVVNDVIPS